MSAPDSVVTVLREHRIECSSKATGEVTCRACRERSWMPLGEFTQHVADAAWVASLRHVRDRLPGPEAQRLLIEGEPTGWAASAIARSVRHQVTRMMAGEQERGEG